MSRDRQSLTTTGQRQLQCALASRASMCRRGTVVTVNSRTTQWHREDLTGCGAPCPRANVGKCGPRTARTHAPSIQTSGRGMTLFLPLPRPHPHTLPLPPMQDLSGDSALLGGLSLFRALQSVGGTLLSLDLGGCSGLPASFVARQLPEACPKLQVGCCAQT